MLLTVRATESHFQIPIAALIKYLSPLSARGQQTHKQYLQFVPCLCKRGFSLFEVIATITVQNKQTKSCECRHFILSFY